MTISTMLLIMIALFIILAVIGVPIGIAIGVAALVELMMQGTVPLLIVPQRMYTAVNSVTLMGIPFFMLAGLIMERSGITERLIRFANALVGSLRGGMCYVSVLTGMLMGGISGSAPADTSALSSLMVPSMEKCGYKREFSAAIMASSGTLGIIIPPSMPMIVLGSITGISVGKLFLGGIIPGILFGISFMLVCFLIVTFKKLDETVKVAFSLPVLLKTIKSALLPMLAPIIIVGGILTGVFTPTESAIAAVAYTLFLGMAVYRTIRIKDLPELFMTSIIGAANVMLIIAASSLFAWILQTNNFQDVVVRLFGNAINSQIIVMIVINFIFLIGGFFLEGTAMQIMFIPVLFPIATVVGINPIAFGVTVICNIALGNLTPPVGVCLFVASSSASVAVDKIIREIMPFILISVVDILLLIIFPQLITWIPGLMK
jgi:C4-dicarboxylate transporter DctM subunit